MYFHINSVLKWLMKPNNLRNRLCFKMDGTTNERLQFSLADTRTRLPRPETQFRTIHVAGHTPTVPTNLASRLKLSQFRKHKKRECGERFPRHWLKRKPLVSDPDITACAWRTCRDACRDRKPAGKTTPAHAQPEVRGRRMHPKPIIRMVYSSKWNVIDFFNAAWLPLSTAVMLTDQFKTNT